MQLSDRYWVPDNLPVPAYRWRIWDYSPAAWLYAHDSMHVHCTIATCIAPTLTDSPMHDSLCTGSHNCDWTGVYHNNLGEVFTSYFILLACGKVVASCWMFCTWQMCVWPTRLPAYGCDMPIQPSNSNRFLQSFWNSRNVHSYATAVALTLFRSELMHCVCHTAQYIPL